jgi:hypothetical protein
MKNERFEILLLAICSLFIVLGCSDQVESKKASEDGLVDWLPDGVDLLSLLENLSIRDNPRTFCNPINIGYQYQSAYYSRESADPAVIMYRGEYYLFASHGSGYWWSDDLANWHFIYSTMPEIGKFAPAACVVGDTLYLTHSVGGAIYKSTNPKTDDWALVGKPVTWDDPALFVDDDGRVYGYYGLSTSEPIYGVELNPTNNMARTQGPKELFYQHPTAHGFEVPGDNNDSGGDCWMEGAWMTKYNGKYYLQYAVPGTEYASYADGYYVSNNPLGPFEFAENSPVTFKNAGFMRGAGHGSTVKDLFGAWWKFDTVSISVNHMFERRLVMVPANFDSAGLFFTNMMFSDYPLYAPHSGLGSFNSPGPGWNLVSLAKGGKASSEMAGHPLSNAFDENMRTWWSAETGMDEWLTADLGRLCAVNAVQINFADQNIVNTNGRDHNFVYRYLLEFSVDNETWFTAVDRSNAVAGPNTALDTSHDYFEFDDTNGEPIVRYLRLTNKGPVPAGGKFAVSGLRVFGKDGSPQPGAITDLTVNRPAGDERSVHVKWKAGKPAAEGYIVVFGKQGTGLWLHQQLIGQTEAHINALNLGVDYEFAVYPYGSGGVGMRSAIVSAPARVPAPDRPGPVYPDEGYAVYEAEDAVLGGGAVVSADPGASGGKTVHDMHKDGAFFELRNVDGGPGGSAVLRLVFSNGNPQSKTEVFLNGASIGVMALPSTGSWNIFKKMEFPISGLKPGAVNILRFVGGQEGFNADYVQIIY